MSDGLNSVHLLGNIGKDPEFRTTEKSSVLGFSLACNERFKSGDEWKERVEWVKVVVWGKRAEALNKLLGKGSRVFLSGRLQTRKWNDKEGNTRYTTEVVANNILLCGGNRPGNGPAIDAPSTSNAPDDSFDPNDMPF
jgi:single-strand DNA-binding protein